MTWLLPGRNTQISKIQITLRDFNVKMGNKQDSCTEGNYRLGDLSEICCGL